MKYKKYPKYKKIGIEWLGEIPEHWEVRRLKFILNERNILNKNKKIKQILSLSMYDGVILYNNRELKGGNKAKEDISSYKIVWKNDIVINSMNIIAGAVGISKYEGIVSPVYYMLYPKDYKVVDNKFYYYIFKSSLFQKTLLGLGNGILFKKSSTGKLNTIRLRISMENLGNIILPLPPFSEQKTIASFLDKQIEKIDTLIKKEEKLIKLLEEKKEALITKVVTKGLNPNVKMKDSGIEWLGKIPEYWEVRRLKYVAKLNPKKSEIKKSNKLVQFIPMEKLKRGKIELNEIKNMIDIYDNYTYFKENDILLAKVTPCFENRNIAIATNLKNKIGFGSSEIYVIRVNNEITRKFIYYLLQEENFIKFGQKEMTGTGGLKRIPSEFIENLKIPLPPLSEQKEIANYLDKKLSQIDKLIKKSKKAIELLKEKKESLITNAVTGKIDVRNFNEA